jgi:hypothetical protein
MHRESCAGLVTELTGSREPVKDFRQGRRAPRRQAVSHTMARPWSANEPLAQASEAGRPTRRLHHEIHPLVNDPCAWTQIRFRLSGLVGSGILAPRFDEHSTNSMKWAFLASLAIAIGICVVALQLTNSEPSRVQSTDDTEQSPITEQFSPASATATLSAASSAQEGAPAVASGPHGKVVHKRSGTPVGGIAVQLRSGSDVVAQTISSADGTFVLPEPARRPRRS